MRAYRVDAQLDREVDIDVCMPCQSIWFDVQEHLQLTPGATLKMFHVIGENVARPAWQDKDLAHCPRCRAQLRRTQDLQRATRFEYYKCPNLHGRLTSFFDFLKEKDFIKPLLPQQIAELRKYAHAVNCSNCGAPVDLAANAHCTHCGSPLTMLDLEQADRLIEQLKGADHARVIDPALPLALAKAKRDTELIFRTLESRHTYARDDDSLDLVGIGFTALMRLIKSR
jgi:Zn-finger nucleic acid-binding protein